MRAMLRALFVVTVAGMTIGLGVAPVRGQFVDITKDEFACESNTAKTFAKFIGKKSKCVRKCLVVARKTSGPYTDCFAPYGGATATCILDPEKGAEQKARDSIVKKCTADCPECYEGTVCTSGEPFVGNVELALDGFASVVFCVEGGAATPTAAEAKCEDAVNKTLAKFAASRIKCYRTCLTGVFKGKLPDLSCGPPPTDEKALACIAKTQTKAIENIDKSCSPPGANPACSGLDGATWVAIMGAAIDDQVPNVACGE